MVRTPDTTSMDWMQVSRNTLEASAKMPSTMCPANILPYSRTARVSRRMMVESSSKNQMMGTITMGSPEGARDLR